MMNDEDNITLNPVSSKNLFDFKKLCLILFPVAYPNSFFNALIKKGSNPELHYGFIAYDSHQKPIGIISWKEEVDENRIHITTLGVLILKRRLGIGTLLFNRLDTNRKISLYVHVENETAIEFYKKLSFKIVKTEHNYYKRSLRPPHAYLMSNCDS